MTSETRTNQELVDQIRRHVKRIRRRPVDELDRDELLELVKLLEHVNGPLPIRDDQLGAVDDWQAEATRRGIPLPAGRCLLSDDGYHRFLEGSCMLCGEPATVL